MTRIRVVLADDDRLVRGALGAILSSEPDMEIVGEATTGAEAVAVVRELTPDIVLMDVRMPEVDGIRATERLLSTMLEPPRILVVTTFEHDSYVYEALRAGASGFLLKRATAQELVQAVRLLHESDSLLFPAAVRALASRYAQPPADRLGGRLTDREAQVLRLMASGRNNTEIANELGVGGETVKTHVASLLGKLRVRDRTQAVIAAYEHGFVRPG